MAVDTATELLFLDTFKHQSAEVTRRGALGPPLPSPSVFPAAAGAILPAPGPPRAAAAAEQGAPLGASGAGVGPGGGPRLSGRPGRREQALAR